MRRAPSGTSASTSGSDSSALIRIRNSVRSKKGLERIDQRLRAIFGEEELRPRHLDHLFHAGDGALQPVGPLELEENVLQRPYDQRRYAQLAQRGLDGHRMPVVERDPVVVEVVAPVLAGAQGIDVDAVHLVA